MSLLSRVSRLLHSPPTRYLYTDRFLGLTTVHAAQEEELLVLQRESGNLESVRKRILASAEKGVLLSRDLDMLSNMAVDTQDLSLYQKTVLRFLNLNQASKISQINAGPHIHKLCQLAHLLNTPSLLIKLFQDENVKKVLLMNNRLASQSYLLLNNLLFKNAKFSHIIRLNTDTSLSGCHEGSYQTHSLLTLVVLALVKHDQPGSLAQATKLLDTHLSQRTQAMGRLTHAYAWLACKEGDYAVAYETLHSDYHIPNKSLQANLQVFSLAELDRPGDAVTVLDRFIQTMQGPDRLDKKKPILCREVIQNLVTAVKDSKDEELISQLKMVFSELDTVAEITDDGIEDLLVIPMDNLGTAEQKKRISSMEDLSRRYRPRQRQSYS